ncbi:hypothetical protein PACTADRAFT_50849 [Pachysolen tannophilus NRRL Y-2460]|uniref:Tetratricopeptide SHNi-TPR domain-containing protein n=1 Tax=Pachysolen tannophilus NRRL Y-2460 TaxID=669874 RepID=A0A1E4TTF4_PACTA|nr:hypothetical protein PACTADRAFT_50849 [Pachysolen tannophilus NRRL Y-2460]
MAYSEKINKLLTEASRLYALKDYENSCSKYGEACELYNEVNGKDDADLLFLYGKSLFQYGVSRSEVFGGVGGDAEGEEEEEVEEEEEELGKGKGEGKGKGKSQGKVQGGDRETEVTADNSGNFQFSEGAPLAEEEEEEEEGEEEEEEEAKELARDREEKEKDSTEDAKEVQESKEEDEPGDFEFAWEILDMTRSLFEHQLEELEKQKSPSLIPQEMPFLSSDDENSSNEYIKTLKKLSETYDILGEVSLEAENFKQSAADLEKSLGLRKKLYPSNSKLISESHYKLSLALEFCIDDPQSRPRAAKEMQNALLIVKNQKEKDDDLIADLEARLKDLEKDPEEELKAEKEIIMKNLLGESASNVSGSSQAQQKQQKIPTGVNDLTSMVKKRKNVANNGGIKKKTR